MLSFIMYKIQFLLFKRYKCSLNLYMYQKKNETIFVTLLQGCLAKPIQKYYSLQQFIIHKHQAFTNITLCFMASNMLRTFQVGDASFLLCIDFVLSQGQWWDQVRIPGLEVYEMQPKSNSGITQFIAHNQPTSQSNLQNQNRQ